MRGSFTGYDLTNKELFYLLYAKLPNTVEFETVSPIVLNTNEKKEALEKAYNAQQYIQGYAGAIWQGVVLYKNKKNKIVSIYQDSNYITIFQVPNGGRLIISDDTGNLNEFGVLHKRAFYSNKGYIIPSDYIELGNDYFMKWDYSLNFVGSIEYNPASMYGSW